MDDSPDSRVKANRQPELKRHGGRVESLFALATESDGRLDMPMAISTLARLECLYPCIAQLDNVVSDFRFELGDCLRVHAISGIKFRAV